MDLNRLFQSPQLKNDKLSENEDNFRGFFEEHIAEIEHLSEIEDGNIQKKILEVTGLEEKSVEYLTVKNNILYLKHTYFLDKNEKVELKEVIDFDVIKELNLSEFMDLSDIEGKQQIEISIEQLKELAIKKNQEVELWNEYNIISTISKKMSISEGNISFVSNLSEYISFVSNLNPAEDYVSRGQKDCTYDLIPSLHRAHNSDYSVHLASYEGAFKQKIIYYDKDIVNRSDEALRAEGQHFGLPTDYLDFTEAHLISLLFAIEDYEYDTQHSVVYFINSLEYNDKSVGQKEKLLDYSISDVVGNIRSKYSNSRSHFIKLGNSNERIHFQKGCFLKVSTEDKEASYERLKKFCKIVIINKKSKKSILKELFNLGITFENIYPDKDNVVKSIKFHYKEIVGDQV
ncbi:MAG: FRG domain-containing protein [Lysinibacillus fusiformis]|nr:FRG domain-containing protein [Lysinibacillus fusiformis]MCT6930072.1 FRG domain-containing protein [Lysinibacillus fusiformis]MCT6934990.1 FRG domain-containing protein [Lysinibacillus fusiformis]